MKNYADLGGCYPPQPSASADNTLLDLHNSSYHTRPHPIIAKCIYYLPRLQQAAASHQNQRVYRFIGSGGFLCRDDCCSVTILLPHECWM